MGSNCGQTTKLPKIKTNSGLQNGLYTCHGEALSYKNKTRFPF